MVKKYWDKLFIILFLLLGAGLGYYYLPSLWDFLNWQSRWLHFRLVNTIFGALIFFILMLPLRPLYNRLYERLVAEKENLSLGRLLFYLLGIGIGLTFSWLISIPLVALRWKFVSNILPVILSILFGALGFFIMHLKIDDLMNLIREIPRHWRDNKSTDNQDTKAPVPLVGAGEMTYKILDTSVIIDGRILDVLRTGFIEGTILVPNFVIRELQYIADSSSNTKRIRGRRGLDILNEIQQLPGQPVEIYTGDFEEEADVDLKLILLAKAVNGTVVTNDFNLNKVSHLHKVKVLNINELANAMKTVVVPGDQMEVRIIKAGTERQQGVGYLDDGTMIVVEEGKRHMDETLLIEVTSAIQTNAGKMIFGSIVTGK